MPDSRDFYHALPALASFEDAFQTRLHSPLPEDWWVVVADIVDSTTQIEHGEYKRVNTVGVACIAALVNVDRNIQIPYVFGGDGALFAIPGILVDRAVTALRGAQALAGQAFGLELRVGLVRVGDLLQRGFHVNLAKVRLSPHITQTCLSGRGWEEAERLVKTPGSDGIITPAPGGRATDANFEGFECRWQSVQHFNGHKLSLLVAAMSRDSDENLRIYGEVLDRIHAIYGDTPQHHPLRAPALRLSLNPWQLSHEQRVRTHGTPWGRRLGYFLKLIFQTLAGHYLFRKKIDTKAVRWSRYRDELVENTDFRKFDGVLRMLIDGNDLQYRELSDYLEMLFRQGRIAYGLHRSRAALVTCLVESYTGQHTHFVDGSNGGYALAAQALKRRIREIKEGI